MLAGVPEPVMLNRRAQGFSTTLTMPSSFFWNVS